jgi:flagellar secretion chaperone FliS
MIRGIGSYQKTETLGKSPLELLLMVYGGAIQAMEEAEAAFRGDNRDLGREKVERAKKFVTHLYTTLDNERGGEIAERLGHLYVFIIERLQVAQASADGDALADVREILENLRSGWKGVEQSANG